MNYQEATLRKYLEDLAAKMPAPGGGSAAALNAALGVSLISMVVNFTLGKPRYAKYENELKVILDKAERLRVEFLDLVDKDVLAYQSKDMKQALNVPLRVARLCLEGVKLCPPLIKKGNINLISDVGVAAVFLECAFVCACFNIDINLKYLGDKKLTRVIRKEISSKSKTIKRIRFNTEVKVGAIIRG